MSNIKQFTYNKLSTVALSFVDMNKTSMDTRKKTIHRGEIVKQVVDKSDLRVTQISKRIHRSRSQMYNDFDNPDMDWTVIARIGKVIRHDFKDEFPEFEMYANSIVQEPNLKYGDNEDLDRALIELDKWKTEAYKNLAEASKWKDLYYELLHQRKAM